MSTVTDALRERLSRRGCTARVRCGVLGTLTVEALSPKDCAALLKKDSRAHLYAACRELQQAGEELRRDRKRRTWKNAGRKPVGWRKRAPRRSGDRNPGKTT